MNFKAEAYRAIHINAHTPLRQYSWIRAIRRRFIVLMATIFKKARPPRPTGFKKKHRTASPNEKKYHGSLWRDRSSAFLEKGGTELIKTKTKIRYVKRCIGYGKNPRCSKAATTVDHRDNASQDHVNFWNESNWQPMCKSCHTIKSNKERAKHAKSKKTNR